jgi:hypothetical protein
LRLKKKEIGMRKLEGGSDRHCNLKRGRKVISCFEGSGALPSLHSGTGAFEGQNFGK